MPNGEIAQILLLEFIEGKTLRRIVEEYTDGTVDDKRRTLTQLLPLVCRFVMSLSLYANEYL